jgi:hypothetical protein
MGTPIIHPIWIYLMGTVDGILIATGVLSFFGIAGTIGCRILLSAADLDVEETLRVRSLYRFALCITIPVVLITTFTPTKETIIQMVVAQNVTYERLDKLSVKGVEVKDALKKDILDIIGAVRDKEGKK